MYKLSGYIAFHVRMIHILLWLAGCQERYITWWAREVHLQHPGYIRQTRLLIS